MMYDSTSFFFLLIGTWRNIPSAAVFKCTEFETGTVSVSWDKPAAKHSRRLGASQDFNKSAMADEAPLSASFRYLHSEQLITPG